MEQELASAREDAGTLEESQAPADAAEKVVASEASATDDGNVVIVSPDKDGDLFGSLKENLSEEDFSQVTNSFAQLRTRIAKRAKGRQEYLASIDVSGMSDSERANHSRFMELMAKREAIAAKMWNGIPDLGSIQELAQISIEMESSAKEERSTLARQMARELGYSGDDVEVIHDTIRDIYDCTNAGGLAGVSDLIEEAGAVGGNVEVKTQVKTQVVEP